MRTPARETPQAGAAGLVFFLLLATEANDVLQYVLGKLFGRHKILPRVSPNKTWEGFLGGWAGTAALILLARAGLHADAVRAAGLLAGLLPLAGFAGDVTMSAVKRDIGVKDTSPLIPGHGGVLDRIDSLTFTAPPISTCWPSSRSKTTDRPEPLAAAVPVAGRPAAGARLHRRRRGRAASSCRRRARRSSRPTTPATSTPCCC